MRKGRTVTASLHLELIEGICYVKKGVPEVGTANESLASLG